MAAKEGKKSKKKDKKHKKDKKVRECGASLLLANRMRRGAFACHLDRSLGRGGLKCAGRDLFFKVISHSTIVC